MRAILRPILAVSLGLALGLLVTAIAGENPIHVFAVLVKSAFGSPYDIGMTLFYATPLIFTGLSVAAAFQGGFFNIGAEGQLLMGALAAACAALAFPALPSFASIGVSSLAAFVAGATWGWIPGYLKAKRGSHEVITTIMLNFIAAGLASWVMMNTIQSTDSQAPESKLIGAQYRLTAFSWFEGAPVSSALFLAVSCAFLLWAFFKFSVPGFRIRACGDNRVAAERAGISTGSTGMMAMAIAGGIAGLVGVSEVLGNLGRFKLDFSPGYGFIGIAVALLARAHFIGVLLSAFLFAVLHKGAADLDLETQWVTRDLSLILQAFVILSVAADRLWDFTRVEKRSLAP